MSVAPLPARAARRARPASDCSQRRRARPPAADRAAAWPARRRWSSAASKWLLPVAALLLLATIALWPEIDAHARHRPRLPTARHAAPRDGGATLTDARYHGVDEHGRPYTVTAATARSRSARTAST